MFNLKNDKIVLVSALPFCALILQLFGLNVPFHVVFELIKIKPGNIITTPFFSDGNKINPRATAYYPLGLEWTPTSQIPTVYTTFFFHPFYSLRLYDKYFPQGFGCTLLYKAHCPIWLKPIYQAPLPFLTHQISGVRPLTQLQLEFNQLKYLQNNPLTHIPIRPKHSCFQAFPTHTCSYKGKYPRLA